MWAEELRGSEPEDLRAALDALRQSYPDFPPTLFEFSNLCRDSRWRRARDLTMIAGPRTAMPEKIKRQLAEFKAKHTVGPKTYPYPTH